MKQKINFKALTYRGKLVRFTKMYDLPDFKVIPPSKIKGVIFQEISIESQIMAWLDEQDKEKLMIERDLGVILDYEVSKKREPKPTLVDYLKQDNLSEQVLTELLAIYSEIRPVLKGKTITTQVEILFSHLDIGCKAASTAYQRISAILNGEVPDGVYKHLDP